MTLVQYYNQYAKEKGYSSWNELAESQVRFNTSLEWLKKQLKREYKALKKGELK